MTRPVTTSTANELATPAGVPQQPRGGQSARTPVAAVRAFAETYINWNANDVSARLQALAATSVDQARSAMTLAAAEVARDSSLRSAGIANSGTVQAIARLPGRGLRFVVVTCEQTSATHSSTYAGTGPSWHVVLATAVAVDRSWAVSSWQPQS